MFAVPVLLNNLSWFGREIFQSGVCTCGLYVNVQILKLIIFLLFCATMCSGDGPLFKCEKEFLFLINAIDFLFQINCMNPR